MSPLAPFGTWDSPLRVAQVAAGRVSRHSLASDGAALYWLEGRPEEAGRVVLVRSSVGGDAVVVSPPGTSIRSRVHEYGGGAWCLVGRADGAPSFAYVEERSQRVHVVTGEAEPVALTPEPPRGERWHHGGLVAGPFGDVLAIRERHHDGAVERTVVRLDPGSPGIESIVLGGRDFFGGVAPSPDGGRVAWVTWDHPDMPWDATELWVGPLGPDLHSSAMGSAARVGAEGLAGSSVDQPVWLDADTLAFVADAGGWWQPWRWRTGEPPVRLSGLAAEFQGPSWTLGQHTLVALGPDVLACAWRSEGVDHVGTLHTGEHHLPTELGQPCVSVSSLCAHDGGLAWLGQTPSSPGGVWWCGLSSAVDGGGPVAVRVSGAVSPLGEEDVSVAEPFSVASVDGRGVHANFYPPRRFGWEGPGGDAPPLIVYCHGGPTASADAGFDPLVQMFTTRGFAVAAVNFAGSTGYGRRYRRALDGQWGVADVDDCVEVARRLAQSGRVDGSKMAIRGASSGGLTALGALVRANVFAAAVSWYGVTDLMGLVATTHDFESCYTDRLIGPLPGSAALYQDRSPLNRVAEITGAVLLFQGEDDPVVPADQTRRMAEALRARGVRCEARYFAGESHGFRRADTLIACLDAELAFYREVLLGAQEPR